MLGGVADNRDDDDADESLGDAECRTYALDRADQKFRKQRHESSGNEQDHDRFAARPMLAFFLQFAFGALKKMSVRLERKTEHAEVGEKKHHGDRQRKPLLHYRTPATWAALCGHMEHRRNDQRDRRQGQGDRRRARASPIKPLLAVPCPAAQDRQPEHEQNVADNRARNRRFDHAAQTFRERNHGNDQFRRVPKRGIQ